MLVRRLLCYLCIFSLLPIVCHFVGNSVLSALRPRLLKWAKKTSKFQEVHKLSAVQEKLSDPCYPFRDLITSNIGGQLGNQIWKYAALIAAESCLGLPAALAPKTLGALDPLFHNVSLPVATKQCTDTIAETKVSTVKLCRAAHSTIANKRPPSRYVRFKLRGYALSIGHIKPYLGKIRSMMQFQKNVYREVRSYFIHLALKYNTIRADMTYIGVHVRRKDYVSTKLRRQCKVFLRHKELYVKVEGSCWPFLVKQARPRLVIPNTAWFTKAMGVILGNITTHKKFGKVVFLLTSDDMTWSKRNVKPPRGTHIEYPSMFYNETELRNDHFDFAVLSHCNHSIYDFGSFGFWSAFLTPGLKVTATGYCRNSKKGAWSDLHNIGSKIKKILPNFTNVPVYDVVK